MAPKGSISCLLGLFIDVRPRIPCVAEADPKSSIGAREEVSADFDLTIPIKHFLGLQKLKLIGRLQDSKILEED